MRPENATDLPTNQSGYFLASQTQGFVMQPGGSVGNLCLGGTIGRFVQQVQNSGPMGAIGIQVDLTAIPHVPLTAVQPGDTWNYFDGQLQEKEDGSYPLYPVMRVLVVR